MMMVASLLVTLLVSACTAEYYYITGTDFNDYIGTSHFHVEHYNEVSRYGIPPPPGGEQSYALYLTDLALYSQTSVIKTPSSGLVHFEFVYICDDSGSEMIMRISYPWQGDDIHLCGPQSNHEQPGQWLSATFSRACFSTCTTLDLWLVGESLSFNKISGLYSLSVATDGTPLPPLPACLSPGSNCASGHGTCRTSCYSNEYSSGSCGGSSCTCCKLYWPYGRFSLPKASEGCPDLPFWQSGYSREHTYPAIAGSNVANSNYMASHSSDDYVYKYYCTKASYDGEGNWPAGDYCIYLYGLSCPSGFSSGQIVFDENESDSANYHTGTVPSGYYGDSSTTLEYCCRNDGYYYNDIKLPTEHPFLLMMNSGKHCQGVEGMSHVEQYITVNTVGDPSENDSQMSGDFPYTCYYTNDCYTSGTHTTAEDPRVYYCYYY